MFHQEPSPFSLNKILVLILQRPSVLNRTSKWFSFDSLYDWKKSDDILKISKSVHTTILRL